MSSPFWDEWLKKMKERRGFFFPEIDRMIEEMEKEMSDSLKEMENVMPRDMFRVRRLPDGSVRREYGPFVYGYSVNIKPCRGGEGQPLNLWDQREPLIDILEENETIKILAELPGIHKDDIKLYLSENMLTIDVDTSDRKYYKDLELPVDVDESSARSTFVNGVLETTLQKKKLRGKSTRINIE